MKKDGKIITGIKKGEKKAEKLLYDRYRERVEKYLLNKYPHEKDIEDCVSEILIKIFQNIDQYDKKRGKFSTWVIKIANNYMIDKARKNENKPIEVRYDTTTTDGTLCLYSDPTTFTCGSSGADITVGFTHTSNYQPISFSQPDQDMENKDALDFISHRIGINDFHLLNMKYKEGYDYKEMESEMKLSSNTLSNRVNYVRTKLKKGK